MRNGDIAQLATIDVDAAFPYCCINIKNAQEVTYTKNGRFMQSVREYPLDIIAILPPVKKEKKPAKKGATNKQWEAGKAKILRILDELEGLLKP